MAGEPEAGGLRQVQDVGTGSDRPLRIGFFTNNYLPVLGGVATAVETVRTALLARGHRVIVVAPAAGGTDVSGERDVVRVPAMRAPTYPDFALPLPPTPGLLRRLARLDLDVFHAHHPFLLGQVARRLARAARGPLVFTHHTLYERYAHYVPLPAPLVRRAARRRAVRFASAADLVLSPSEAVAARLRAQGVASRIETLPTGIDPGRFHPGDRAAARRDLGLEGAGPLLLYVGRLDREKNLPLLLEAFRRAADARPDARLVLVGRGTRAEALRAEVRRWPAGARIRFAGGVEPAGVADYYRAADVFLFASTTETQGLAVLEAMATGLPVVAVRASGVEEAIVDGVSGRLVAEDARLLAEAALEVLADPHLAAKLGAGARERAAAFTAGALADRLAALYRQLLASRP